jgi:hypothetical protein
LAKADTPDPLIRAKPICIFDAASYLAHHVRVLPANRGYRDPHHRMRGLFDIDEVIQIEHNLLMPMHA